MEYVDGGSLQSFLHNSSNVLGRSQRLRFKLDLARGLQYLHENDPPILHLDLKSANCLLTSQKLLKLADFGLSGTLAEASSDASIRSVSVCPSATCCHPRPRACLTTICCAPFCVCCFTAVLLTRCLLCLDSLSGQSRGSIFWLCPAFALQKHPASRATDIYSSAIVHSEIETRLTPYEDYLLSQARQGRKINVGSLMHDIKRGQRPSLGLYCPKAEADLAKHCWNGDPSLRYRPSPRALVVTRISTVESAATTCSIIA